VRRDPAPGRRVTATTIGPARAVGPCAALGLALAAGPGLAATPVTIAALPPEATAGRGAPVPFVEYEAENAATNGELLGPDRRFTTLAAEASGRKAVRLSGRGRFVEFTLARAANAVNVRYAIPDTPDGAGRDTTLGVYVGGRRIGALATTSRYGWFYGAYPFTNRPGDGRPHHFYDEARLLLGRTLPAGAKLRLMVGESDEAPWYVVDLADFELVPPPFSRPPRALSVARFGADPFGLRDSTSAFRRAVAAGRALRRPVWIPPGTFQLDGHLEVDRVSLVGAGPWRSVLRGRGVGIYGREAPAGSRAVVLRDFAILGDVRDRDDHAALAGIGGAMGGGSRIDNLWIQHVKVGLWFDGPMDGIAIRRLRVTDTTADGLNFHRGVGQASVEESFFRNTGDDGLAAWSGGAADHDIVFRRNTIVAPVLANGIALYGGRDMAVTGNLVADTLTEGGGIHVGNRFGAIPASGRIDIAGNIVVRGGSFDPNWHFGVGALWFYALDAPLGARIEVEALDLVDSSEEAIQFIGKRIEGVVLNGVRIRGASHGFQLQSPGSAAAAAIVAADLRGPPILDCQSGFILHQGDGNSGLGTLSRSPCVAMPQ
jgi:hypothetical protein